MYEGLINKAKLLHNFS